MNTDTHSDNFETFPGVNKLIGSASVATNTRDQSNETPVDCQWFALCENPATTTREHSILGNVPICGRCNAKIERLSR